MGDPDLDKVREVEAIMELHGEPHLKDHCSADGVVGDVWVLTKEERDAILRALGEEV